MKFVVCFLLVPALTVARPYTPEREPCNCSLIYKPVCGTDGRTYANVCMMLCARYPDVRMEIGKQCDGECPCYEKVTAAPLPATKFTKPAAREPLPEPEPLPYITKSCLMACPKLYSPVCGRLVYPDRKGACVQYTNACVRKMAECKAKLQSPRAVMEECYCRPYDGIDRIDRIDRTDKFYPDFE